MPSTVRLFCPDDGPGSVTVADVVDAYLADRQTLHGAGLLSKSSLKNARLYCLAFREDCGAREVAACRRSDLLAFVAGRPEYRSPHTKRDVCAGIVACFRWAEEAGIIDRAPYKIPKELPVPEPRAPIKEAEVRLVLADGRRGIGWTPTRFRLAVWFLWETGCRTCELFRLDWSQYDPAAGVFVQVGKSTRRTGKRRLIVLPYRAWRLIRFLRRWDKRPSGAVFLNGRGRPWNKDTFSALFRKHARSAGVREEVTAYSCRHGFTVRRLEAGTGERQLADYLGHSSTRFIGWYGRGTQGNIDYLRGAGDD